MPRPRAKIEMTLFPFLSVLCGLIAVLVLHIFVVLSSGRAEARGRDGAGGPRASRAIRPEEAEALKRRLTEEIVALQAQLLRLQEEIAQLRAILELRRRQDLVAAAGRSTVGEPIGAPAPMGVRFLKAAPDRGDLTKLPVQVVVTAERYAVRPPPPGRPSDFPALASDRPEDADPGLLRFLDEIQERRRDQYLFLLVDAGGIEAFQRLRQLCKDRYDTRDEDYPPGRRPDEYFDFGYEPFSARWQLSTTAADGPG